SIRKKSKSLEKMVHKKGKGRAVKRARQKFGRHFEEEDVKLAPHSMVIHRGDADKDIKQLVLDFRKVMEPYTARDLKVSRKNNLKDFVSIAGPLHVSHLLIFSQTELGDYLKITRLPRGPTIHFKLIEYSLTNDVLSSFKKKHTHQKQFLHQPLLILNGFNAKNENCQDSNKTDFHQKLVTTSLQNMFPSINITKVKLNDIRRCILFNYNKDDQTIDFRQYYIRLMPTGLSKPVKKLVQEKLPDLSNCQDISEFMEKSGMLSESEAEFDGAEAEIQVKQDVKTVGSLNLNNSTSAIRLSEIGPRLKLKLFKIEEGVCDGEVMYHEGIKKSSEEIEKIREMLKMKKKLNKEVKKKEPSEKKPNKTSKKSKKRKYESNEVQVSDDDDAEYFKQELGHEPDNNFMLKNTKINKSFKKRKIEKSETDDSVGNVSNNKENRIVNFEKDTANRNIKRPKFFKYSAKKKQSLRTK
ncbi:Peter pan, partial [Brachionus plicatilis]